MAEVVTRCWTCQTRVRHKEYSDEYPWCQECCDASYGEPFTISEDITSPFIARFIKSEMLEYGLNRKWRWLPSPEQGTK